MADEPNEEKTKAEKTFANEDNLPSLIVPDLKETISKYLDSCRAVLPDIEYAETMYACQCFLSSPKAFTLHNKLLKRAQEHKNWLEEWWLDKAYLELRAPLSLLNYSGPASYAETHWPLQEGTQLARSAWNIYAFYLFWKWVRFEQMPVHRTADGKPLSMNQFRYIFNTYRRPRKDKDELLHYFKTKAEGPEGPTHMIVLKQGYMFEIDCYDRETKEIKSADEILKMLEWIDECCKHKTTPGPSVGVLTTLDRNKWASVRDYLINHKPVNKDIIESIEKSIFVLCLDETSPVSYTEVCKDVAFGNWHNRWYDKAYQAVGFKNGGFATNCDHTPSDAMVMTVFAEFNLNIMKRYAGQTLDSSEVELQVNPKELDFILDEKLLTEIDAAKENAHGIEANVDVVQPVFTDFGKKLFKELRIHPDFAVQITLQLTYMQLFGNPAPTYETAMTRKYYHGRTETVRTCTPEAVQFCRSFLKYYDSDDANLKKLQGLLEIAQKKFMWLMSECMLNKGCDRHLFALSLIAHEENLPMPELYHHPSYEATGGNGNFVLSTSCLGYSYIQGAAAPMVEHGYGCFYRINDEKIVYSVTSFNSCPETSSQKFAETFEYNLKRVIRLKGAKGGKM